MSILNLFKRKKPVREKRNFDNVSWQWINKIKGERVPEHHVFWFENGLGVIVFKNSIETFDGMEVYSIDDYTEYGKFHRATGLGIYDHAGGLDEERVLTFCKSIKEIKR